MKLLFPFAKRFIAGESLDKASEQIQSLHHKGFRVAVNLVGEQSKSTDEAFIAQKEYLRILDLFQTDKISLSIKPSMFGLSLSLVEALGFLKPITAKAFESGQTIRLDMEDSSTTDNTIKLCQLLNQEFPNVMGITMQSNLYRTRDDLQRLKSQNISIRLVKGAYRENKEIAFMASYEIKDNFILLANDLKNYNDFQDLAELLETEKPDVLHIIGCVDCVDPADDTVDVSTRRRMLGWSTDDGWGPMLPFDIADAADVLLAHAPAAGGNLDVVYVDACGGMVRTPATATAGVGDNNDEQQQQLQQHLEFTQMMVQA